MKPWLAWPSIQFYRGRINAISAKTSDNSGGSGGSGGSVYRQAGVSMARLVTCFPATAPPHCTGGSPPRLGGPQCRHVMLGWSSLNTLLESFHMSLTELNPNVLTIPLALT